MANPSLDALSAQITKATTVEQSAEALIGGISARIADAVNAAIGNGATADQLKRQGVTFETREALSLSLGRAFLVIGRQEVEKSRMRKWILVAASPALTSGRIPVNTLRTSPRVGRRLR